MQSFDASIFAKWVSVMSLYLRSIDPYHHPISTSFSFPLGHPLVDGSSALDFSMTHTCRCILVCGQMHREWAHGNRGL